MAKDWTKEIPEGAFISKAPTYKVGEYFNLYKSDNAAGMKYYEFNDYEGAVVPRLPRLEKMKHCFVFTPDWVYNGDKGIASINFGTEMGQHCLVNPMACNLLFDDGSCMDERLPNGLTEWISKAVK